ncbi:MAG: CaiB/BaiF CoA-transferase family protein [Deferribacterota bacterium]|nr:CaiB/BaiF CoA-transferase family protein [Deferribacterota bacterium]
MCSKPLSGIKVLELASVLAGPSVGMFLAEVGATVIKIENPKTYGDVTRAWKLPTEDPKTDISAYFTSINWGKKSLSLDLSNPKGLEILYHLAKISHIILVSYKPGDAEKLKVDYNTLKRYNKSIIYVHITGYGLKNSRAGYDAIIQAESGFTYINGEPSRPPVKMPVALMDVLAAHQAKEAILLSLLQEKHKNDGAYIDVSLLQSGVSSLINQATNWLVGGVIPKRMGSEHPNIVPYGKIFYSKDGKPIVLAVGNDKQFTSLCKILGEPELANDKRFINNHERVKHREELYSKLQNLILKYNRDSLLHQLHKMIVPAGGVYNMKEVFEQSEAKELLINGKLSTGKSIIGVKSTVFNIDLYNQQLKLSPPPHYGEHSIEILREELKYTNEIINNLVEEKVIYSYK